MALAHPSEWETVRIAQDWWIRAADLYRTCPAGMLRAPSIVASEMPDRPGTREVS